MPYRRRQRNQKKHAGQPKISQAFLKHQTPEKVSLIQYGLVPESVSNPISHQPLTMQLASSSKNDRDCGVSAVCALLSQSDSSNMDHTKMTQLWKALFYAFWMSDKVLVQQDLAKRLSDFIKLCGDADIAMLYVECFMQCMEREWCGIDYLRMSKFLSLVRYFVRSALDYLALNEWDMQRVQQFANILRSKISLLNSKNRGLFLHLNDIFMEELIKVNQIEDGGDDIAFRPSISFDALYNLLTPFIHFYLESSRTDEQQYVIRKVFHALLQSMHFDEEERETLLRRPGAGDIDLYGWNVRNVPGWMKPKNYSSNDAEKDANKDANKGVEQLEAFMDEDEDRDEEEEAEEDEVEKEQEQEQEEVDLKTVPSNQLPKLCDDRMTEIDPLNPLRRKKNETHLMFDKINYDVVMPFNRTHREQDGKRMKEWQKTYAEDRAQRLHDPLLLASKMKQFQDVFDYLANDEETPKKAVSKLWVLSRMFTAKSADEDGDGDGDGDEQMEKAGQASSLRYNRDAVKKAITMADNTKLNRKRYQMEKARKRKTRVRTMKEARLRKLKKKTGVSKVTTDKRVLRRVVKFIK